MLKVAAAIATVKIIVAAADEHFRWVGAILVGIVIVGAIVAAEEGELVSTITKDIITVALHLVVVSTPDFPSTSAHHQKMFSSICGTARFVHRWSLVPKTGCNFPLLIGNSTCFSKWFDLRVSLGRKVAVGTVRDFA